MVSVGPYMFSIRAGVTRPSSATSAPASGSPPIISRRTRPSAAARLVVHDQHPRHARGALQVRDAVADDLRRDREVVVGDRRRGVRPGEHLGERAQRREHLGGRDAVVDQAGDLVDADALQRLDARDAVLDGAEQARVLEVAAEGELEHAVHLVLGQRREVELHRVADARRLLEGGEGPGVLLDQRRGAAQVVLHRLAGDLAHRLAVGADEGVQHQRDLVPRRVVAGGAQRRVVEHDLVGDLLDRLSEQVGQHVGAERAGLLPGVGVAGGGDPDRQLGRDRPRLRHDRERLARRRSGTRRPRRARAGAGCRSPRSSPPCWRAGCSRGAARSRRAASRRRSRGRRGRSSGCR